MTGSFKTALIAAIGCAFVAAGAAVATTKTVVPEAKGSEYTGIGAAVTAFKTGHATGRDCGALGVGCYKITRTLEGRVVSYSVKANKAWSSTNRQRLSLVEGASLPTDARKVRDGSTCQVFQSRTLRSLVGMRYVVATTLTGTTSAQARAKSSPRC